MDTIIACASGGGSNYGVGLIRISGFDALEPLLEHFYRISSSGPIEPISAKSIKPRYQYFSKFLGDNKEVLDEVLFTFFPAPHSFTGENVLEISVHGNQINIERIINLFIVKFGFRLSEPGEFTRRAFKNKKLSLSQVEGLDLFLNAESALALKAGIKGLSGEVDRDYDQLYQCYLELKAAVEINFDFAEDVGEERAISNYLRLKNELIKNIQSLYAKTENSLSEFYDPEIVLIGKPNSGKSSVFNFLLKKSRSIVSEEVGTTRDYISENLFFDGKRFKLIDTAGIRETSNKIEKAGIEVSMTKSQESFFKVLIIDGRDSDYIESGPIEPGAVDIVFITRGHSAGPIEPIAKHLKVLGKVPILLIDFIPNSSGPIEPDLYQGYEVIEVAPIGPEVKVSKNSKLNSLLADSVVRKFKKSFQEDANLVPRQREKIKIIYEKCTEFQRLTSSEDDFAIISSELNILGSEIEELLGITPPDEVLNYIFSNFCIGK